MSTMFLCKDTLFNRKKDKQINLKQYLWLNPNISFHENEEYDYVLNKNTLCIGKEIFKDYNDINEDEHARLAAFSSEQLGHSIPMDTHLADGRLMTALTEALETMNPDLIVLCTHGVKGLAQHLFGARILALVQSLDKSFLVVHENTAVREEGFAKILEVFYHWLEFCLDDARK